MKQKVKRIIGLLLLIIIIIIPGIISYHDGGLTETIRVYIGMFITLVIAMPIAFLVAWLFN